MQFLNTMDMTFLVAGTSMPAKLQNKGEHGNAL
jgi:hypothetical protein